MNFMKRQRWLAIFNLHQWVRHWYNLETPQSMHPANRQACQAMDINPVDEG